jgi:hypothetical protein
MLAAVAAELMARLKELAVLAAAGTVAKKALVILELLILAVAAEVLE